MLGMNNETKTTTDPSLHTISWSYLSNKKTATTGTAVPEAAVMPKRRNLVGSSSGIGDRSLQQQQQEQQHGDSSSSNNNIHDDDKDNTGTLTIQLPALTPDIIPCQHAWVLELSHIGNLQ
jgi:hypothetical protein